MIGLMDDVSQAGVSTVVVVITATVVVITAVVVVTTAGAEVEGVKLAAVELVAAGPLDGV